MVYSEQGVCPDCRTAVGEAVVCPTCRLDLTTAEVATVRQALASADAWLARAARVPVLSLEGDPRAEAAAVAAPAPEPVQAPVLTRDLPSHPGTPAQPVRRRWTAGGVILALGAACLLVAGLIFVGVAWGLIGASGRAALLLLVTAAVGVVADRCTTRRLGASATSLWSVFLGLLTIDWFFGRALGFAGLDALRVDAAVVVWAALVLVTALLVGRRSESALGRPLAVMTLAAGAVPLAAGPALSYSLWDDVDTPFWPAVVALAVAIAVLLLVRSLRWELSTWLSGSTAVVATTLAVVSAFAQAAFNPRLDELLGDGDAVPLVLVLVASLAVAGLVPRPPVRVSATVVAATALGALVVLPTAAEWGSGGGWLAVAGLVLLGAVATSVVPVPPAARSWLDGPRLVVAVSAGAMALAVLPWAGVVLEVLSLSTAGLARVSATEDLSSSVPTPFSVPVLAVLVAVLSVTLVLAGRWSVVTAHAWVLQRVAGLVAFLGVLAVVADTTPQAWASAVTLLAGGAVLGALWRADRFWGRVGPALAGLTPIVLLNAETVVVVAAPVAAVLLVAAALLRRRRGVETIALVAGATWWVGFTTAPAVDLLGGAGRGIDLAVVIAASVLVLAALLARPHADVRLGMEIGAAAVLALGVVVAATFVDDLPADYAWVALVLTVPGVVASAVAVLVPDRRSYVAVGSPLLGVAWVLRLLASDVEVVEAYTAPFAAVLLVAGVVALLRRPELSTRSALTPGVVLSLVPSLPQALADPTGPRAAGLAVVAVAFLAVGLVRRWQVPFVLGSGVVALLLLVNVGPYAWAVPRWIIIAVVGILLTLVGMTWEQRVREGRSAVQFLSTMR